MPPTRRNLVGLTFGRWTVLYLVPRRRWMCRCSCGVEKEVIAAALTAGTSTKCLQCAHNSYKKEDAPQKGILNTYKQGARVRNFVWQLSDELFYRLITSNCHYCGTPPNKQYRTLANRGFIANGIDRIDSKLGYTPENAVTCCSICNRGKGIMQYEEFMNWINSIKCQVILTTQ